MLPDTDELAEVLLDLAVPHQDIDEAVRLSRHLTHDQETLRTLRTTAADLVQGIDTGQIRGSGADITAPPGLPPATARFYPLYVFVAALPHLLAHHRARGIPDEISRRTLADVGRCVAWHRRWHGTGGLMNPRWLTLHFRGELYQLGRLQFQRGRIGRWAEDSLTAAGLPLSPGDPALALHIPDFMGPLTPPAVDRSLALARDFFARHYPDEPYTAATCGSWLLDPQLRHHLPKDSNIVHFQDRFHIPHLPTEPEDTEPVRFVFGTTDIPLDRLPRRTALQQAVVGHLQNGGHWHVAHGWLAL